VSPVRWVVVGLGVAKKKQFDDTLTVEVSVTCFGVGGEWCHEFDLWVTQVFIQAMFFELFSLILTEKQNIIPETVDLWVRKVQAWFHSASADL